MVAGRPSSAGDIDQRKGIQASSWARFEGSQRLGFGREGYWAVRLMAGKVVVTWVDLLALDER